MTKAQKRKLETIIIKIELLQQEVDDPTGYLSDAKSALMRMLSEAK